MRLENPIAGPWSTHTKTISGSNNLVVLLLGTTLILSSEQGECLLLLLLQKNVTDSFIISWLVDKT